MRSSINFKFENCYKSQQFLEANNANNQPSRFPAF